MSEGRDEMDEGRDEMSRRAPRQKEGEKAQPQSVDASAWRLFCAVELPAKVRARAIEHVERLRLKMPQARASWEREEKLHLTLKFFGDVEQSRTGALSQAIERAANSAAPFPLAIADAGAFPPRGAARVLWLGVRDESGGLAHLQQALEDECAAAGFKRETRSFHPHLTIARLRAAAGAQALAEFHRELGFAAMALTVNEVVLLRSELSAQGSCYSALAHHGLAR